MFITSEEYKERIYTSNNDCLLNIYIEDNLVDDDAIFDFKITHNLFESSSVTLGTTTSKTVEMQIARSALPDTYENFYIETGLNIDGEDEIVPIGFFTLEEIEKDDDYVTLTLGDYMLQFERTLDVSSILPCTTLTLLKYLCERCGVELRFYIFCE